MEKKLEFVDSTESFQNSNKTKQNYKQFFGSHYRNAPDTHHLEMIINGINENDLIKLRR